MSFLKVSLLTALFVSSAALASELPPSIQKIADTMDSNNVRVLEIMPLAIFIGPMPFNVYQITYVVNGIQRTLKVAASDGQTTLHNPYYTGSSSSGEMPPVGR